MTARQRGTRWHSTPDAARRSVRLSGVTVPRDVLDTVRLVAGSRRGALSAAVSEALREWLASADIMSLGRTVTGAEPTTYEDGITMYRYRQGGTVYEVDRDAIRIAGIAARAGKFDLESWGIYADGAIVGGW